VPEEVRAALPSHPYHGGTKDDWGAGHWRAINPGVAGSFTVTSGTSDVQVSTVKGPDLLVSQADSVASGSCQTRARTGSQRPLSRVLGWDPNEDSTGGQVIQCITSTGRIDVSIK
jgi:hypothetical protein